MAAGIYATTVLNALQQLSRRDSTLKYIDFYNRLYGDSELVELVDCLLAHPDVVTHVWLQHNQLTDETGVKLARYIATSTTIQELFLDNNQLSCVTYLAMAAALRINSSLRHLCLCTNQIVDKSIIDAAFVDALILNRNHPSRLELRLYSFSWCEFERLRSIAEQLGHPNMQALLAIHLH